MTDAIASKHASVSQRPVMETQLDNVEKICMNLFNSIAKDTTDVRKITFLLKHSFFIRKCSSAFVSHNP